MSSFEELQASVERDRSDQWEMIGAMTRELSRLKDRITVLETVIARKR